MEADRIVLKCPDCGFSWQAEVLKTREEDGDLIHTLADEEDLYCYGCPDLVDGVSVDGDRIEATT